MRGFAASFLTVIVLVLGDARCYAQSADHDVMAVIDAYHRALSSRDVTKMDAVWAHDEGVMLIEPFDATISLGWKAVKERFDQEFAQLAKLRVSQVNGPYIQVRGNLAWSTGMTNASVEFKDGTSTPNAPTFETAVFEKRQGQWFLVAHTASQVAKKH